MLGDPANLALTHRAFGAKYNVDSDSTRRWRKGLGLSSCQAEPLTMVRVDVTQPAAATPPCTAISASIGAVSVRFDLGCGADFIGTVLGAAARTAGAGLPC